MFSNHVRAATILLLIASSPSFAGNAPGQVQTSTKYSQAKETKPQAVAKPPAVNRPLTSNTDLRARESKIESKLQANLEAGKIDSEVVTGYQDRINELRAKEEELRSGGAMTGQATQDIMDKLNDLETDFDKDL